MKSILYILFLYYISVHGFSIQSPAALQDETFSWVLATFSARLGAPGVVAPLAIPKDNLACNPLNSSEVSGKIVLLDRGGCAFVMKVEHVIAAGGLAALIANNQDGSVTPSGAGTLAVPVIAMLRLDGTRLRNFTRVYGELTLAIVQNPMRADQKKALIDLYLTTGGANWTTQGVSNNPPLGWAKYNSTDPCQEPWQGISCNPDGTIRVMQLGEYAINGNIPTSLSALDTIETCSLATNSLAGTLPHFFATFTRLSTLDLSVNSLEGTLPQDWSKNNALKQVTLSDNKFSGTIPASLFSRTNLTILELGELRLSGTIPAALGQLTNLTTLNLKSNLFEGEFPDVDLLDLTDVDISNNKFSGTVPSFMGQANLTSLNIANNNFSGDLPDGITDMESLRYFDISRNQFAGVVPIPGPQVRYYIASYNQFTSLSTSLGTNCPFLSLVDFSHNSLTGPYTEIVSRLPAPTTAQVQDGQCLQYIDLSYNNISAPLAQTFQVAVDRWPLLVSISYKHNALKNNLQFIFGSNAYLRSVDVSDNPLTGAIPSTFASLPDLENVYLTNTSMKYVDEYLPAVFTAHDGVNTFLPELHMSCPQIVSQYGAVVHVDNDYHSFELCHCEPGYRRKTQQNSVDARLSFECIKCPDGLACPGRSNDTMYLFSSNFFPSPSVADPMVLIKCANCKSDGGTFQCAKHHSGRMCSQCLDNFYWDGTKCSKCIPLGSALIVCSILLLIVALTGFALYSMFLRGLLCNIDDIPMRTISSFTGAQIHDAKEAAKALENNMGMHSAEDENAVNFNLKSLAAISIAINYYQTVSALSQYFSLPNSVISLLSASKILSSATGAGVGLACISQQLNQYEHLYMAVMLEPVIVLGAIVLFYLLGRFIIVVMQRVPTFLRGWGITCLTMLLFAINFLFFPISSTAINSFRCTEDPFTGIKYNSAYPFARCDGISRGTRAGALLLYSGGIMTAFSALVVIYNKSKPGTKTHSVIGNAFGFFFLHYRKKYNMAAILVLFRRFILSLLISVIPVNTVLSFGLVSFVLVVAVVFNTLVQPFKSQRDNYLETLTILAALFAYTLAFTLSIKDLDYHSLPVVIFYFLVNIAVVIWCGIEFLQSQVPKVRELLLYLFTRHKNRVGIVSVRVTSESTGTSTNSNDW